MNHDLASANHSTLRFARFNQSRSHAPGQSRRPEGLCIVAREQVRGAGEWIAVGNRQRMRALLQHDSQAATRDEFMALITLMAALGSVTPDEGVRFARGH